MADKKEWLKELPDGGVQVTLRKPVEVSGVALGYLTMREPTVDDQISASLRKGNDAQREAAMIADLCGLTPADAGRITVRDWRRLQEAFLGFTD